MEADCSKRGIRPADERGHFGEPRRRERADPRRAQVGGLAALGYAQYRDLRRSRNRLGQLDKATQAQLARGQQ